MTNPSRAMSSNSHSLCGSYRTMLISFITTSTTISPGM
jgi:hypothetical protein